MTSILASNFDDSNFGPPSFLLGNSDSENPIVHVGLELIDLGVIRELEAGHEAATVSADLKNPLVLKLEEHVFVGEARERSSQDVGIRRFAPVDPGIDRRSSQVESRENAGKR
ncbi:hypothetical protein TorRG33x02_232660 [Trema orientale]|uniref:Uncharacterized protein n=1 Tax=Trema orientale TaxID=63057 RepID=A0A2P5E5X1_TREOI|nr:hypothetical protein TorRG33x02_232660 [Trema orientale]